MAQTKIERIVCQGCGYDKAEIMLYGQEAEWCGLCVDKEGIITEPSDKENVRKGDPITKIEPTSIGEYLGVCDRCEDEASIEIHLSDGTVTGDVKSVVNLLYQAHQAHQSHQAYPADNSTTEKIIYMMIGLPASGKSTYRKEHFSELPFVSKDVCGTAAKEKKQLEALLDKEEKVIVDDTNYNLKNRQEIFAIARRYNAQVVGIYFEVDKATSLARNKVRPNHVPEVAIHTMAKNFQEPTEEEGFKELIRVKV